MAKIEKPKFYVMYKDFNDGKMHKYEVLESVFDKILNPNGSIHKKSFTTDEVEYLGEEGGKSKFKYKISVTKPVLRHIIDAEFRDRYWARCEWEFLAVDWPYREHKVRYTNKDNEEIEVEDGLINENRDVKIDAYEQLKPNLDAITDLVWNYIEPKLKKDE